MNWLICSQPPPHKAEGESETVPRFGSDARLVYVLQKKSIIVTLVYQFLPVFSCGHKGWLGQMSWHFSRFGDGIISMAPCNLPFAEEEIIYGPVELASVGIGGKTPQN